MDYENSICHCCNAIIPETESGYFEGMINDTRLYIFLCKICASDKTNVIIRKDHMDILSISKTYLDKVLEFSNNDARKCANIL